MPITNYDQIYDREKNPGQALNFGSKSIMGYFSSENVIIPMGIGVVISGEDTISLPNAADNVFAGITYYSDTFEQLEGESIDTNGRYGYPVGRKVSVIVESVSPINVYVDSATNVGDPVFCRFAVGSGATQLGVFRNDADTASAFQIPVGRFQKTVAAPIAGETAISTIVLSY